MLAESQRLEAKIKSLQEQIKNFPEGKLICAKNGKFYKWYQSDGHHRSYIPKANQKLAEQLAEKKIISVQLEQAIHEKSAVDAYLKQYDKKSVDLAEVFTNLSGVQELLSNSFHLFSKGQEEWMKAPYEKNMTHLEQLKIKAFSGNIVRSKSEAIIDMALFIKKIPFRYDAVLRLGTSILCPDFTILHPYTGQIFYWEHFGRMDEEVYYKRACVKLKEYIDNNILPNVNLIITYETKANPLTPEKIEKIVEEYFY